MSAIAKNLVNKRKQKRKTRDAAPNIVEERSEVLLKKLRGEPTQENQPQNNCFQKEQAIEILQKLKEITSKQLPFEQYINQKNFQEILSALQGQPSSWSELLEENKKHLAGIKLLVPKQLTMSDMFEDYKRDFGRYSGILTDEEFAINSRLKKDQGHFGQFETSPCDREIELIDLSKNQRLLDLDNTFFSCRGQAFRDLLQKSQRLFAKFETILLKKRTFSEMFQEDQGFLEQFPSSSFMTEKQTFNDLLQEHQRFLEQLPPLPFMNESCTFSNLLQDSHKFFGQFESLSLMDEKHNFDDSAQENKMFLDQFASLSLNDKNLLICDVILNKKTH